MRTALWTLLGILTLLPGWATAQEPPAEGAATPDTPAQAATASEGAASEASEAKAPGGAVEASEPKVTLHGAVEAAFGHNFNVPSNGVTAFRYYDAHHDQLGLQAAALGAEWEAGSASGHIQLQFGGLAEQFWGTVRTTEQDVLWRLLQEVTATWKTPYEPIALEAGVFTAPFGPEYGLASQNWLWSDSNLFAIMPYQIAGMRANLDLGGGWTARAGVYNGWDQIVVDNNSGKSGLISLEWENPDDEDTYATLNYMIGDERDRNDSRGPWPRSTFDLYGQWHLSEALFLRAHVFAGFEPTRGETTEKWYGAAVSGKFDATPWLSIAARGDMLQTTSGSTGSNLFHADQLADPTSSTTVGSGTLALDVHTGANASLRLEGRYDKADFPLYFGGNVPTAADGSDQATEKTQVTLTLGLTTWF